MASYLSSLRNRVRPGDASFPATLALGLLVAAGGPALAPSAWAAKSAAAQPTQKAKAAPAAGKDDCQAGRSQYSGGDVLRAIASLERCVDKEPGNRPGWAALATARLEAGRFSEAADAYGRAHALRAGDVPFLVSYLDALEGAGRAGERVAVLRALSETRPDGVRYAGKLLALIDSLGSARHPEDRLFALERLSLGPDAEIRHQEKLAAAYLERGWWEKAQAEYRGLLSRKPEVGAYWGGLAASIAKEDPAAAVECYRKAIFFSDQAQERSAYEKAVAGLKAGSDKAAAAKAEADRLAAAKASDEKASREKAAKEEKEKQERLAREKDARDRRAKDSLARVEAERLAKEKSAQPKTAAAPPAPPAKPFDIKAFQDSVFKAELAKRLAVLKKPESSPSAKAEPASPSAAPSAASPSVTPPLDRAEQERKAKADRGEKEKQEKLAREEKARQEKAAKEEKEKQEKLAREEKEKQERLAKEEKEKQEKLAKEAARKAEEERKLQEKLAKAAAKQADEERKHREKLAKDSLAQVEAQRLAQEKAARELRDRFVKDSLAKAEKEKLALVEAGKRQKAEEDKARKLKEDRERFVKDSLVKADKERLAKADAERKAKEARDLFVKDSLAKADKERLAKADAERKAKEARDLFVKDSLAKVEKERLAKLEAERKAKEVRDRFVKDSLAKVEKERLAKLEEERKAKEVRDRFVKDSLAKVEKARLAKLEEERKAKEVRDRFVKDSLAKVEQQRLARLEEERKAREAREKFVKDSLHKVELEKLARLEAERKAKEARDRFVKDSLAKVEQERLARLEAERKAREEQERKERLAREKKERHDLAIAHYKAGRLDSAEALFKVVLEETPGPDAFYHAGRLHLDRGRADKALELLLKAPKDLPGMDGYLGRAYLKTGKKRDALESLERHFAKTADLEALADICELRKPSKDQGPWAACMEKLAEKRPTVGRYQEELAVHYRIVGEKGKSLERWAKLLVLEPAHGEANYQLGMDWGSQGVHNRAVPCLEKAVAAFPERSEAWKLLAKGQAATGRRAEAWNSYGKAAALLPKDLDVARGRLALAKDPGREADLPGAYQTVLRLAPADGEANMGYARLRFAAKDYPAAEKHFRAGIGSSKEAAAWGHYGRALLETRKLDEAAVALQKALDLGETSVAIKLDLARLQLDKGDADKAEVLVKQISSQRPADPEPYYWLAKIAEKRQQAAVQEEFLRKAHQLKPDEVRYAEALARLFKERDEFKQAIGVLGPNEARLTNGGRMLLADCLAASGEGRRALDIYTALYRTEPGPTLLAHRIDALVRMGKAGEAVDAARGTAFADKPEVQYSIARAHLSLSEAHVLKGDLDLAISLLKKAVDADGHRPEYHFHLGRAYHMRGKPGKARDAYTDALRYRVDYPDAVYWKGMTLVEDGKALVARDFFGELSQHADPRWKARGLTGLARVFEAEGKWEAVEHHLQRSIATLPNAEAMAYLSRVNLRLGRFPEAEDWARKAVALEAGHEEGTVALAEALAARKKIPEALGLSSAALKVKPLSCDLLVQAAKLNLEAGRFDSTLTTTGKAIEVCPGEPLPHYYAGMAMRGHNKPEDAKRHFKSFRKLGGDSKMLPE